LAEVYRIRRGKKVLIPAQWVGRHTTKKTIRGRASKLIHKYRKGTRNHNRHSQEELEEKVSLRELLDDLIETLHVDTWIMSLTGEESEETIYAAWFFAVYRQSPYMGYLRYLLKPQELFCTYQGKKWRVMGCSRLGPIWLRRPEIKTEQPYKELAVPVVHCTNWSFK
jgi:hypothetical protein